MKPYAELLEFNQPSRIRREGFTRVRDQFKGLQEDIYLKDEDGYTVVHHDPERIMEFAGRWDYGENNARKLGEMSKVRIVERVTPESVVIDGDSAQVNATYDKVREVEVPIIQKYLDMGHESMVEMGDATFFIECSRVVSHELVRHRLVSYQQESQRFVKYDNDAEFDIFYVPDEDEKARSVFETVNEHAFSWYRHLRAEGVAPQVARYVLPNSMRTRLVMKTNVREWRHIIRLRVDKSAQPEMAELMKQVHLQLVDVFPNAMHGVLDEGRGVR